MRSPNEKIELTPAQRKLILYNIAQHLKFDSLTSRHHAAFECLERKGIFFIDENFDVQLTCEARNRLLNVGIDINGNKVIGYLKLDPLFLESERCFKRWVDRCRVPSPRKIK